MFLDMEKAATLGNLNTAPRFTGRQPPRGYTRKDPASGHSQLAGQVQGGNIKGARVTR